MATSIPVTTDIGDLTSLGVSSAVKTVLDAKYADAGAWAVWAAQLLEADITRLTSALANGNIDDDLANLAAEIGSILNPPASSAYDGSATFNDELLVALRNKLLYDLEHPSNGLGSAEGAIFARETERITAERATAYTEISTQISSRGFPAPTGQLLAKQTELSNETSKRLTDSSGKILEVSAQLALDQNKHVQTTSMQMIQVLAQIFDSKEMRVFEAYKATISITLEEYKSSLSMITAKADILLKKAQLVLEAKSRQLNIEVETIKGLAQSAAQMVASSLNSVNVSSSLGFSGNVSNSTSDSTSESIQHIFEGV